MKPRFLPSAHHLRPSLSAGPTVPRFWAAAAASLLLVAAAGYAWFGAKDASAASSDSSRPIRSFGTTPSGMTLKEFLTPAAAADPVTQTEARISAMVDGLAGRMKTRPNDAEGWRLLGKSYASLGRRTDAVASLRRAVALRPKDKKLRGELTRLVDAKSAPRPAGPADARLAARWRPTADAPMAAAVALDVESLRPTVNGVEGLEPDLRTPGTPDGLWAFAQPESASRAKSTILRR